MSENAAISVRGLTKEYRLGQQKGRSALSEALASPFRRNKVRTGEWFRALDDVSLEVAPGTALGVVGRNGAGKSTFLKVLSRITKPTDGEVVLRGRVGSLLEVGTGFHPELTGRENVFMNGAMLGMRRVEITRKFDDIVDFAEVSRFIDTPVKRYSSGMYVRLAFSVAAHLEPEILLVDEVLAVGDAAFQKKCLGKMGDVVGEGRTVLFVSHNTAAIQQLTSQGVLLERGAVIHHGPIEEVLHAYLSRAGDSASGADLANTRRYDHSLGQTVRICWARLRDDAAGAFRAEQHLKFDLGLDIREEVPVLRVSLTIFRFDGTAIGTGFGDDLANSACGAAAFTVTLRDARLAPGRYYIAFGVGRGNLTEGFLDYDVVTEAVHFEVLPPTGMGGTTTSWHHNWGMVRLDSPQVEPIDRRATSA